MLKCLINFYDYAAAGLPIINSLKGEVGKIIKKENIGINYNPDNNDELYDAIIRLSKNASLRKLMATNSFEIGSIYDKKNQIKKFGPLLNEIIASYNKHGYKSSLDIKY